ncbi:MAG: DinB family protein [Bacteroidota bacterium]
MEPLPPPYEPCRAGFETLCHDARILWGEMTPGEALAPPAPGRWSPAQCLAHLNAAARPLVPALEACIFKAQRYGPYGEPPFRYGWLGRLFIASVDPESAIPIPAPPAFRPLPEPDPQAVLDTFCDYQRRLAVCVARSQGLDWARVRVASPALPVLYLGIGAWFEATLNHERRHLQQAHRARGAAHHVA